MVQFLAFVGALLLGALAKRIGAWKTVLISLGLWIVVVADARSSCRTSRRLPFVAARRRRSASCSAAARR